jgi:long-chain acyl-CoA synthetase
VAELPTLPRFLLRNAQVFPTRVAMREKDRGIWQAFTWREYHDHVRDLALGLAALGFARGDKLSVIGDNRPRLYWAQIAAQCGGGVAVPVYQDSIARELAFVLDHAEVSVVIAEDQEQVDKILSLRDQLPRLRLIVYDDPRGMSHYHSPWLTSYEEVLEQGRRFGQEHPGFFEAQIEQGGGEDVAMLAYTSGTTGHPKGAMLTHRNLIGTGEILIKAEDVRLDDEWLAYLPMAWVGDSLYTLVINLMVGFTINCPESPETVQRDLRELGPTAVLAPPRIWENMLTAVQVRAADATPLKRWVFERFRRGRQGRPLGSASGPCPGRVLCLWSRARSARAQTRALGIHGWGAVGRRYLPVLPIVRGEPQASLRLHRGLRARLPPARRRGQSHHGRATLSGHRGQDCRPG